MLPRSPQSFLLPGQDARPLSRGIAAAAGCTAASCLAGLIGWKRNLPRIVGMGDVEKPGFGESSFSGDWASRLCKPLKRCQHSEGGSCTSPAVISALLSAMQKAVGTAQVTLRSVILLLCKNKCIRARKQAELLLCLMGGWSCLPGSSRMNHGVHGSVLGCHQAVGLFGAPGKVWQCDLLPLSTSAFLTL